MRDLGITTLTIMPFECYVEWKGESCIIEMFRYESILLFTIKIIVTYSSALYAAHKTGYMKGSRAFCFGF